MDSNGRPLTRRRRRLFSLLASLLPFAAAFLLEGGLRVAGFGRSYPLFVPVPGAPDFLRVNHRVVFRFMVDERETPKLWIRPVYFRRQKTPSTFRIFVQGGSTAEGYPYGYGASPAGMLQQRLQRELPDRDIEVVTTAMSAVNSYTLLDFSAEIIAQGPDAVVVYAGHNEYVGLLGVGSGFSVGRRRPLVLSFLRLKDCRIFQLSRRAVLALGPEPADRDDRRTLMATIVAEKRIPYGSSLYRRGLAQFRANLRTLLRRYGDAGIPVFVGTVVSNERHRPPFLSGHGEGADVDAWRRQMHRGREGLRSGAPLAALAAFDAATAIDDLQAEGHFARGLALEALGRYAEARRAYLAAKDRDELRFRAPEPINAILREVAAGEGSQVVEVEAAFVAAAEHGIVGEDLLLEHVHPNLDGYFILADAFYGALRGAGLLGRWERPISTAQARLEVPVTAVDRLYGEYRIRHLTSDWPFSDRPTDLRIPPPAGRVEELAQRYFRGRSDWPATMRELLDHYRSTGDALEAAKVAVLLAEAFPNRAPEQRTAADLLEEIGRPEARVYRRHEGAARPSSASGVAGPAE